MHAENACRDAELGGDRKLWQLYGSLAGFPLNGYRMENKIFISIHDLTDDIDDPDEYQKVVGRYTLATSNNRLLRILINSWVDLITLSLPFFALRERISFRRIGSRLFPSSLWYK